MPARCVVGRERLGPTRPDVTITYNGRRRRWYPKMLDRVPVGQPVYAVTNAPIKAEPSRYRWVVWKTKASADDWTDTVDPDHMGFAASQESATEAAIRTEPLAARISSGYATAWSVGQRRRPGSGECEHAERSARIKAAYRNAPEDKVIDMRAWLAMRGEGRKRQ